MVLLRTEGAPRTPRILTRAEADARIRRDRRDAGLERWMNRLLAIAIITGTSLFLWSMIFDAILATAPPLAERIVRALS